MADLLVVGRWSWQPGGLPPAAGELRTDSDDWSAVSLLALTAIDVDGTDHTAALAAITTGASWQLGPVQAPTSFEAGGAPAPPDGDGVVYVGVVYGAGPTSAPGGVVQVVVEALEPGPLPPGEPAWITVDDVKLAAGVAPASSSDDAWLAQVTSAANGWAFDRRAAAGYDDDPTPGAPAPNARVQQGTALYALGLYRERGTWGQGAPGFEDLGGFDPPGPALARVRQLLGIPRPVIG